MTSSSLSEYERIKKMPIEEWRAELEGVDNQSKLPSSHATNPQPTTAKNHQSKLQQSLKEAGIISIRHAGEKLLISTDRTITVDLDNRIKRALPRLAQIAEPDTGETLYEYMEYRTLFSNRRPHLALVFKEIHTGEFAERYFNIILQNKKGKSFKTGVKCEFRIVGTIKRPMKGSFNKFWLDMMNVIPDGKPSHIYRYVNSKLSGVVISCPDPEPHHDGTKLHSWKYEGRLYKTT